MESVVLRFVSNGEYLNFLKTDNLDVSLEDIRKRLKEECSDILPGPFRFNSFQRRPNIEETRSKILCATNMFRTSYVKSDRSVFDVFLRFDNIQDWPCQTNNKLNDSSSIPAISTPTLADISKLSPMPVSDKNESLSETKRDATDYNLIQPRTKCSHLRRNRIDLYSDTEIES